MKAVWNDQVLAESDKAVELEGYYYFPQKSVNTGFFHKSNKETICPNKGKAWYFNIEVDGKVNKDAAWFYPLPKESASFIKDHIAFNQEVDIIE